VGEWRTAWYWTSTERDVRERREADQARRRELVRRIQELTARQS
jgi:hypothetical protein